MPNADVSRSTDLTTVEPPSQPGGVSSRAAEMVVLMVSALLRLPLLGQVPNGLFLDEASRGYDAFALLLTGADQYGARWPLFPEGLDDFTPILYTLLVVPAVAALGLTEVAVRLPAALVGILTVFTTYLCGRALLGGVAGLAAAALVAISPWHILPSRTGAEWVLLPLFMTAGVWLLVRGRRHGPSLLLAGLTLGIGLYSYAFARLLVPLLVVGFAALWWRELLPRWRWAVAGLLVIFVLAVPIIWFGLTPAGQARLQTVVPLDRYRGLALIPYAAANFASYFGPAFLVWGAEPTDHHRVAGFGPILPVMVPLIVAGFVAIARRPSREGIYCLWWMLAAPASAAPREPVVGAAAGRDPGLAAVVGARGWRAA
jgi:4-amino-4-deoxy-L-arabinose transferase-like glycosyltransferase